MALIPENETEYLDVVVEDEQAATAPLPSKTWEIDFASGTIGGFIDNEKATQQYAIKALITERSRYLIYTDDYGNELFSLVGQDVTPSLLDSEIPRMIEEALVYDDRIDSVQDITYTRDGDKLFVSFRLVTETGEEVVTEEVAINGV